MSGTSPPFTLAYFPSGIDLDRRIQEAEELGRGVARDPTV
jgi:hypothetical protein